jgi:hypothetical protein
MSVVRPVSVLVSASAYFFFKSLRANAKKLEPVVGFEPTTDGLQNRCSTTELNWLKN